jgi:hypothetical protein
LFISVGWRVGGLVFVLEGVVGLLVVLICVALCVVPSVVQDALLVGGCFSAGDGLRIRMGYASARIALRYHLFVKLFNTSKIQSIYRGGG